MADVKVPWPDPLWEHSGILSLAKPWSTGTAIFGTVMGIALLFAGLPVLVFLALLNTVCEALRLLLVGEEGTHLVQEGHPDDVTIVLPGTCAYLFWQLGMIQYICERFDTRGARLVGVSSGAICSAVTLAMEEVAESAPNGREAALRVRKRAQELFQVAESRCSSAMSWPLGFVLRLGSVLDALVDGVAPSNGAVGGRVRVGVRTLTGGPVPAFMPDVVTNFRSRDDLSAAVLASAHVWLLVRPLPMSFLSQQGALCGDGVNPFSFYCFFEYLRQLRSGLSRLTAPAHTHGGRLDRCYSLWNCGVMKLLLPRNGRHLWATPTVGGRLDMRFCLRFSRWFAAEQWRQGYAHARELDARGYWSPLPRRHLDA